MGIIREAGGPAATRSAIPYVAPFIIFIVLLLIAKQDYIPLSQSAEYGLRVLIMGAVIWAFSRHVIDFRVQQPLLSLGIGAGVFLIWIGPDALIPGYRSQWIFQNPLTGQARGTIDAATQLEPWALVLRSVRAIIIVPIVEELFWRAWLMRWLMNREFWKLPLGAWSGQSFFLTAVLFASEHGPYWEVGLVAGIIYNWWMLRTKSLGDLILAHAVTNACLCAYVIVYHKWEYWL